MTSLMVIGGIVFDILPLVEGTEKSVSGDVMRERAVKLGASMSKNEGNFILEHQDEIPEELRKYFLVFPGWKYKGEKTEYTTLLLWYQGEWYAEVNWAGDGDEWYPTDLLVRYSRFNYR